MCELINSQLIQETQDWFINEDSLTITADIGTIQGLSLLVLLVLSEKDKTAKLVGVNPIRNKTVYLANEIFQMLKH